MVTYTYTEVHGLMRCLQPCSLKGEKFAVLNVNHVTTYDFDCAGKTMALFPTPCLL